MSQIELLDSHPGIAGELMELMHPERYVNPLASDETVPTAIAILKDAVHTGDPEQVDAALRAVIPPRAASPQGA